MYAIRFLPIFTVLITTNDTIKRYMSHEIINVVRLIFKDIKYTYVLVINLLNIINTFLILNFWFT